MLGLDEMGDFAGGEIYHKISDFFLYIFVYSNVPLSSGYC